MAAVLAVAAVALFGVKTNGVAAILFGAPISIVSEFQVWLEATGAVSHVALRQWQSGRLSMAKARSDQRFGRLAADRTGGDDKPGAPGGSRFPYWLGSRVARLPAGVSAPQDHSDQRHANRDCQPNPDRGVHSRVWWAFIPVMGPQLSGFVNCEPGLQRPNRALDG